MRGERIELERRMISGKSRLVSADDCEHSIEYSILQWITCLLQKHAMYNSDCLQYWFTFLFSFELNRTDFKIQLACWNHLRHVLNFLSLSHMKAPLLHSPHAQSMICIKTSGIGLEALNFPPGIWIASFLNLRSPS